MLESTQTADAPGLARPVPGSALFMNGAILALMLVAGALAYRAGVPLTLLTRDPVASMDAPIYLGAISHVGILLWCAGSVVGWACYALMRGVPGLARTARFFLCSGALFTLLMLDDMFLLHEVVLPQMIGIQQKLIYAAYAGLVGGWLVAFRHELRRGPFWLLAVALGCLACSVGIDVVADRMHLNLAGYTYVEDGLKLVGILNWTLVLALMADAHLRRLLRRPAG